MKIKTELLKRYITDIVNGHIEDFEIDANTGSILEWEQERAD